MKSTFSWIGLLAALWLAAVSMSAPVRAETAVAESLKAAGYAREMPPGAPMGAAYLHLRNLIASERVLERIELPAHPGATVELHTTLQVNGMSRMRALKNLTLPGHGTLEMRPGATHLMVHGLRLQAGDTLAVKLVFADGGSHQLTLPVLGLNDALPAGMRAGSDEDHHGHHDHHHGHG